MRLRTCILLEISALGTTMCGVGLLCVLVVSQAQGLWSKEARASSSVPHSVHVTPISDTGELTPTARRVATTGRFLGTSDDVLLAPLRDGQITSVKFNHGGSSLSLRIEFDDGSRAAFKPNQINSQSVPRKEVAAFRVDRLLQLRGVPPALGRRFFVGDIRKHLKPESLREWPRFEQEAITHDGYVDGELSWWIPVIEDATINNLRMDSNEGIAVWKRYLSLAQEIPPVHFTRMAQLSTLIAFDFLIDNPDRWSGGNLKCSGNGDTLFFMDNAMSFVSDDQGHFRPKTYLERVQKFSRSFVQTLRETSETDFRSALSHHVEPFDFLLSEKELNGLLERRETLLAYIDGLIASSGQDSVLVFP